VSELPHWIARSEANREHVAARFLELAGYRVYLPRIRERGRVMSLFPSYLFVVEQTGWWAARWAIGVSQLVTNGNGGLPATIPDTVVDNLRRLEHNGIVKLPEEPKLKPGDPVVIKRGVFQGQLGLYAGMRGPERVAILLAVPGTVTLAAGDIAPV
jgi:transcription antitermination factor NusG